MTSLQEALDHLHDIVYVQGKRTSTSRLDKLADYVVETFEDRGLGHWKTEKTLDSFARDKAWDIVHTPSNRPRIAISLKSILRNLSGSVPNRTDDLIGEVTDLQMRYPEIIVGYVVVVDTVNTAEEPDRSEWAMKLEGRLDSLTGRQAPFWDRGTLEASLVIRGEFEGQGTPEFKTPERDIAEFFEEILEEYDKRFR